MKNRIIFLFISLVLIVNTQGYGQSNCEFSFVNDTLTLPEKGTVLEGVSLETTLKNQSVVKIFKSNDDKLYIKFITTENFYFDKIDVLEIMSGSKTYPVKNTKQYKINKTRGMFVIEVFKNYIVTLKDEGMTSIIFGGAETNFTRKDANQIKKISICFYETIYKKK